MKYAPILFSTPLVIANLEGRKTQTRRIIKPQPDEDGLSFHNTKKQWHDTSGQVYKPKAMPGDIFWVRETTAEMFDFEDHPELDGNPREEWGMGFWYRTDGELNDAPFYIKGHKWKPSIFMPKEACRLFLKVTNVRVERLQDISEEDAKAEGVQPNCRFEEDTYKCLICSGLICRCQGEYYNYMAEDGDDFPKFSAKESFFSLWESINGKESLDANPWLFVYEYEKIEQPENWPNV